MTTSSSCFLGIDVGTSGIRATVVNVDGDVVAEAKIPLLAPRQKGNAIEQDPRLWWDGLCHVLRDLTTRIDGGLIKALCLDGTSGTVLLSDQDGEPISPGLMYNDARAANYLHRIAEQAPPNSAVHSASSGLAKLLWLQEQAYADRARWVLHQADWLTGKLCGRFGFSDVNNCLKTGYNPVNKVWPDWLIRLGVDREWLPEVTVPGTAVGNLSNKVAEQLGLCKDTLVLSGTTDSTAAFIATGANDVGEAVTSLGSTLVLKVIADKPVFAKDYGVYSQPLGDYWLVGGSSNSGGAVLRHFFSDAQMRAMERELKPEQPTGLDFYPLLQPGERFPHNDPGWPPRIDPRPADDSEFFQALLEGLTAIEHVGYQRLAELGASYPSSVRTVGGGTVNRAWMKMRELRLEVPVIIPEHTEAAYGMAQLARQHFTQQAST